MWESSVAVKSCKVKKKSKAGLSVPLTIDKYLTSGAEVWVVDGKNRQVFAFDNKKIMLQ